MYVIKRRVVPVDDSSQLWQDIATNYKKSEIILSDLSISTEYEFCVATVRDGEENIPPFLLRYIHLFR